MVEFLKDGGIRLKNGRILYLETPLTLDDYKELNCDPSFNCGVLAGFPVRASAAAGGGGGFGGGGSAGSGIPGSPGAQGTQGFQGPFGGMQGIQGPQGWEGFQGIQGLQGSQGRMGSQAQMGPQGWAGFQGSQGNQGAQGSGFQGNQGIVGTQGAIGFQGRQGPQGNQGPQGAQGNQGFQGRAQVGTQGAQGFQTNIDMQFSILNVERKIVFAHTCIPGVIPGTAGIRPAGLDFIVLDGTETAEVDPPDQYVNYAGTRQGWTLATVVGVNTNQFFVSTLPIFLIKLKTGENASDVTSHRMWYGFMSWDGSGAFQYATADSDTPAENIIAFRCAAAGADVNWKAVTDNGSGVPTVTDTGVPIVADTKYEFVIDCRDSAAIAFYINGVLVATNTTKIPTTGFGMLSLGFHPTLSRNLRLSLWYMTRY